MGGGKRKEKNKRNKYRKKTKIKHKIKEENKWINRYNGLVRKRMERDRKEKKRTWEIKRSRKIDRKEKENIKEKSIICMHTACMDNNLTWHQSLFSLIALMYMYMNMRAHSLGCG